MRLSQRISRADAPERGAALLLVIGVLVLLTSAAAALSDLSVRLQSDRTLGERVEAADSLLITAEELALSWLVKIADTVVLSPDATHAAVAAGSFQGPFGELQVRIELTAFDQEGMLPLELLDQPDFTDVFSITTAVKQSLRDLQKMEGAARGLDLLDDHGVAGSVFPHPLEQACLLFGEGNPLKRTDHILPTRAESALGAYFGTQNERIAINLATAPMELVEAALAASGIAGAELIRNSRLALEKPVLTAASTSSGSASSGPPLALVTESHCWAFRFDLQAENVVKSWWCVFQRKGSRWKCVQRLVIPS